MNVRSDHPMQLRLLTVTEALTLGDRSRESAAWLIWKWLRQMDKGKIPMTFDPNVYSQVTSHILGMIPIVNMPSEVTIPYLQWRSCQ